MARKTPSEEQSPEVEGAEAPVEPKPPQGITPRYMNTSTRADFHRNHASVQRIDPESLRILDKASGRKFDPFLRFPNGAVMQVRADHAAELLECHGITGGPSVHRLATDAEIAAMKDARAKANERR